MKSFEELQVLRAAKVAGPQQQSKSKNPHLPSTVSTTHAEPHRTSNIFSFIKETYRDLQGFISGLQKVSVSSQLMQTINKYKNGCKEIFEKSLESFDLTYKLAQNIVGTMDILKELYTCLSDLEEYNYRLCELMSIYIVCELRLSVDAAPNEQLLIAHRIIYTMRKHLVQEEENEFLYNILRTLVYIPKFFNARDIMCAIFSEFIPLKPVLEVNVLPDKLYILYIIVFYRWMMMQKKDDDKILIINVAENFMKPSVSLCSNNLYGAYLPVYTTHSTATRTILKNLNNYWDIRNASIIDNAFKPIGAVNLCDDDDEDDDIIVVGTYQITNFGELFASTPLETLSDSMSNIKLEEKTVVDTVDLTREEEPINPVISLSDRHDKWLNEFKKLAQQYRESQLSLRSQQNNQLVLSGEKEAVISLDSDTEEEDEISAAVSKETFAAATATQQSSCEDLFVDNYPLTSTPLYCDFNIESFDADEDANDVTKISPRFWSNTLRTYQAKKTNLFETGDINKSCADEQNSSQDMDKLYKRVNIRTSSAPEEMQNEEDIEDKHDEEDEVHANSILPTTNKSTEKENFEKQIRPMGPYPTYNSMHNEKVVFSQTTSCYSQPQQQYKAKQYYYSDSSLTKSLKNQKVKVQFHTTSLRPTASSASNKKLLKPALQQTKYKVSNAPEYHHLRGLKRFSCDRIDNAASTAEPTNSKCVNQPTLNIKHYNNNKQKPTNFSIKQKSLKNVKINLKKLRLDKDISNTDFKSSLNSKEEPHKTTLTLIKNNSYNHINNTTCTQTESCQLETNFITSKTHNNEDDIIFKKPHPVTKKIVKSPKPLKIQKVVSLRRHPYCFKRGDSIEVEAIKKPRLTDKDGITEVNLLHEKQEKELNLESLTAKDINVIAVHENKMNVKSVTIHDVNHTDVDELSRKSKLLADEINSLTCEFVKKKDTQETNNFQFNRGSQKEKGRQISIQSDLVVKTSDNYGSAAKQIKANKNIQQKENKLIITNIEELNKMLLNVSELATSADDPTSIKKVETHLNNLEIGETIDHKYDMPVETSEINSLNNNNVQKTLLTLKEGITSEILGGNERNNKISANENKEKPIGNDAEAKNTIIDADISTKDGNIRELTENKDSNSEVHISEDIQTSALKKNNEMKTTQKASKPVTNFSAEFLAGLPNEPSSSAIDSVESECENKNDDIDFEFENNCTTPTMCRLDLDVISENTSDVQSAMSLGTLPIEECEAGKLLEDFNNKTENIVETTFLRGCNDSYKVSRSKNSSPTVFTTSNELNNVSLAVDAGKENLKKLSEDDVISVGEELISKAMKKTKSILFNNESNLINFSSTNVGPSEQRPQIFNKPKIAPSSNNGEKVQAKKTALDCNKKRKSSKKKKKIKKSTISIDPKPDYSNQKEDKEAMSLRTLNKQSKTVERNNYTPTKKHTNKTIKSQSESSYPIKETEENNSAIIDQSNKDVITPHKMESNINENQHMTVQLDEIKTNNSVAGGVSAIFSFPKIPVISISIHTTPSNKTYFKISNRENDHQTKDSSKTKKIKSPQPDIEIENSNEEETLTATDCEYDNQTTEAGKTKNIKSLKLYKEVETTNGDKSETNCENAIQTNDGATQTINKEESGTTSTLETNEISNKETIIGHPADEYKQQDEEFEREEELDEETDNFEIEKFSHDSNSACSLPLKKRPTQAEPNNDTEDSQAIVSASYEQPEEIAAEVVIENTDKNKTFLKNNTSPQLKQHDNETETEEQEINRDAMQDNNNTDESLNITNDFDGNKPSTSSVCFKKILDTSSPFRRRVHTPIKPTGQTPIQIVAPQLKDSTPSPSQGHRTTETQVPSVSRMGTQNIQTLPESYPATPMLSVANVEKLMDFNRFTEDLLASPDVMTIIHNANACGYYAEGQTYEMERIAILEHYNIANAKGNTSATKPLYWKKSAGDTIFIFDDNDNEWISLPPSTAKQLQKLSFVLSILQQQYKVTDIRQRINIALTFLIRNTSKYKTPSNSSLLQQRMPLYSRNLSDLNSSNHNISQLLAATSYYRIATNNNEVLNTNFNLISNLETASDFHSTNHSNNQQQPEMALHQEPTVNSNQNWNGTMHFVSSATAQVTEQVKSANSPQRFSSNSIDCEQHQQQQIQTADKRNSCCDELINDQLYINPPCDTSPQNEVIVNTNGVELHEIPQDPQNIFISITDESATTNGSAESSFHKFITRQQQQQFRTLEDAEASPSSSSITQQSYAQRTCLGNNSASLIPTHFMRNNIISTFGNQEINLQNPYRVQQQQMTNRNLNTSPSSNFSQKNILQKNSPINIYNNNRPSTQLSQQRQNSPKRMCTRLNSSFNTQLSVNSQQTQAESKDSNYKEILQPYITYLIKDHEKTSKHLLQVFEEVCNSNNSNRSADSNLNQQHQQFHGLLPPLIKNPQQNHMPGFHQLATGSCGSVLPSLIRNPHANSLVNRESGALQLVQSFLEQSQTSLDAVAQQQQIMLTDQEQQQQQNTSSIHNPGFVNEYINFVGCRDELTQKHKLRNFNKTQQLQQQQQQQAQFMQQQQQQQQEIQRLNSVKRKYQERNNKLAEDLKPNMMEFSLPSHIVQVKQLEKHHKHQEVERKQIEHSTIATKRRGRPKKVRNKLPLESDIKAKIFKGKSLSSKDKHYTKFSIRITRRKKTNIDLPTVKTTDHAYFRQRSAAREAAKRINATINSSFY